MSVDQLVEIGVINAFCAQNYRHHAEKHPSGPYSYYSSQGMIQTIPLDLSAAVRTARQAIGMGAKVHEIVAYVMRKCSRAHPNLVKLEAIRQGFPE